MESLDYEPLLTENINENTESRDTPGHSLPKSADATPVEGFKVRTLNVEPVLVLFFLAFVPSRMLIEQFLYTLISEEHNVTSIVRLEQSETHCTVNKSDPHFMEHAVIQDEASRWAMYLKFTQCIPSLFIVLASGTISDRVSRKLPILLPLFANAVQMGMCVVMVVLKLPKQYLFIAYLIDGASGSYITLLMGCFAYTGNATTHKNRTLRIAINELCIGIAIAVSDVGIGYMIKRFGFLYPFIFVIGIQLVNIVYAVFVLQETQVKRQSNNRISCSHILEPFAIYARKRTGKKRWILGMVQCVFWCYAFAAIGRYSVATLYLQNVPFCWNAKLLGYYAAVSAVVYGLGNIIPAATLRNKNLDVPMLIVSCISAFSSMILQAFSFTTFMIYSVIFVAVFHQLGYTMLRSLMSKQVSPEEQGAVFASVAFIETASDLIGNVTFNSIYAATLLIFRGFVFLIVATIFGIATLFSIILYWRTRNDTPRGYSMVNDVNSQENAAGVDTISLDDNSVTGSSAVTTESPTHIKLSPAEQAELTDNAGQKLSCEINDEH